MEFQNAKMVCWRFACDVESVARCVPQMQPVVCVWSALVVVTQKVPSQQWLVQLLRNELAEDVKEKFKVHQTARSTRYHNKSSGRDRAPTFVT